MAGDIDGINAERDLLSGEGGFIGRIPPGSSDSLLDSIRRIGSGSVDQFYTAAEIGRTLGIRPERSDLRRTEGLIGTVVDQARIE